MLPRLRHALGIACALALAACGDGEVAGARLRIVTSAPDGALQGELRLQSLEDGVGRLYTTQPTSDGARVAPGAPSGHYRLFTTAGWGMLWTGRTGGSSPLLFGADHPPTEVRMGKPRSLYLASGQPGRWTVSTTWAAEWKVSAEGDRSPFQPAAVRVEDQGEGIVALRFGEDVWAPGHLLRVVGLFTDGTVAAMQSYEVRDLEHPELPRMALLLGAVQAPLSVHLVPPPGAAQVRDGTPVRARLRGVALDHAYEQASYHGEARFEETAALGHGLRVELPQSGPDAAFDLESEAWRIRGSLYAVAVDPNLLAAVDVVVPASGLREARVCYAGGSEFGRVAFHEEHPEPDADERTYRLATHAGWQEWWLLTGDGRWLFLQVDVPDPPDELQVDGGDAPRAGCRVRGQVRGGGFGARVAFRQLHEALGTDGGAEILPARRLGGEGFEAAVSPQGGYEAHLPPGRYEIQVLAAGGGGGRPTTLTFAPGAEVRLDLEAR